MRLAQKYQNIRTDLNFSYTSRKYMADYRFEPIQRNRLLEIY